MLNEERVWDDRGTGHVSSAFVEKVRGLALLVRSEDDGESKQSNVSVTAREIDDILDAVRDSCPRDCRLKIVQCTFQVHCCWSPKSCRTQLTKSSRYFSPTSIQKLSPAKAADRLVSDQ